MEKLKAKIDKIIGFKLQFNAPAYYLNKLFKDILDWIDNKITKLENKINNINLSAENIKYNNDNYNTGDNVKSALDFIIDNVDDCLNVQANWNETNSASDAYIKNKPNLSSVATSGDYNDLSNKPTIPTVNDGQLTLKVGNNTKTFTANQSTNEEFEIKASDLGLSAALTYCGITTSILTDGSTTNPIIINGINHTANVGCVVFYNNKEYVWNGYNWEELGYPTIVDLTGYKTKQTAVSDPTASGSGDTFIATIKQNANGEIEVTKKNIEHLNIIAGHGINVNKENKNITISGNNNYRVGGEVYIATTKNIGSLSYKLTAYQIISIVTKNNFKIFNISDIPFDAEFTNLQYNYQKTSENEEYIGLAYFSSTAGYYIFDVTIIDNNTNSTITHTFCVLFDTPNNSSNSGLFTLVTTLNWDIIIKKTDRLNPDDDNKPYNTEFFAYLKVPKKVQGDIKIKPRRYDIISGANFGLLTYVSGAENTHDSISRINIKNTQDPDSITSTSILAFSEPIGNDIGDKLNTPIGKHKIDIIYEFGEISLGDIIDGNLINNLMLTSFNNELVSIKQML